MNSNIQILIVEDEPDFRLILQAFTSSIEHFSAHIVATYDEAIECLKKQQFDIAVLDILLGDSHKNGIDIARFIRAKHPQMPIVFITHNYTDSYYELAKSIGISRFLDKHLSRLKFRQAIELSIDASLGLELKRQIWAKQILVKVGTNYKKIFLDDIDFFYTKQGFSYIHTDNVDYPLSSTLTKLTEILQNDFVRIHQSHLVNIKKVENINTKQNRLTIGNHKLPIGETYRKNVFTTFTLLR